MSRSSFNSVKSGTRDPDSWSRLLEPPVDETLEEKEARLHAEAQAKHISDSIDAEIERQRQADKKGPKPTKILLLGQSESGKSTTLKNFQIMWDPESFTTERESWRSVIQLNVVRSVQLVLEALGRAQSILQSSGSQPSSSSSSASESINPYLHPELLKLQARLGPLQEAEKMLTRRLTPPGTGETEPTVLPDKSRNALRELAINSTTSWKGALTRSRKSSKSSGTSSVESRAEEQELLAASRILHQCATDMDALWKNPAIKRLLRRQNIRLEDMAGFFLDSIERVTGLEYTPSDDDILRARLKTLGASEHKFMISPGQIWRVFDIGGHRSLILSATWVPYFDDVHAIIFLAPISCFDQMLAEDSKVNRLEDSVNLWIMIVENKMLKDTNMILFLNKIDILRAKLESGIRFADHVVSYQDRPNDPDTAASYLRKKFAGILKERSILPRPFYCHLTTVIDVQSTKQILSNVKDLIMRRNLSDAALLT